MSLGASGRHARGRRLGRRGAAGLALGTSESEAAALGPVASVVEFSGSRLRAPPWQRSMRGKKASLRRLHTQLSRRGCRVWALLPWHQSRGGRFRAPHRMAGTLRLWPRTRGGYRLGGRLGVCSQMIARGIFEFPKLGRLGVQGAFAFFNVITFPFLWVSILVTFTMAGYRRKN